MNSINVFFTNWNWCPTTAGLVFNIVSSTSELTYSFVGCWFLWGIVTINFFESVDDLPILPTEFRHEFNVCPGPDFGGFDVVWMVPDFQLAPMSYYLQQRVHVWTRHNTLVQECSGALKSKSFHMIFSHGLFPQTFWSTHV